MNISNKDIHKILFLDIETVAMKSTFEDLSKTTKKMWQKKSKHINRFSENSNIGADENYETRAGIYSEFGKIVCISIATFRERPEGQQLEVQSFYGDVESKLLLDFFKFVDREFRSRNLSFICGHNIREFDIPYICRRAMINSISLPKVLQIQGKRPWENKFILDTMELWRFGDYKNYTSLELLADSFGIPSPKASLDGSKVNEAYWEDRLPEIIKYCEEDTITVVEVFLNLAQIFNMESYSIVFKSELVVMN